MKAEITVTRTPGEIEHHITVEVSLDRDGDVVALPVETVHRRVMVRDGHEHFWMNLPEQIAVEGKLFELTDEEIEEAKKAIASNQAAYDAQMRSNLEASLAKHEDFLGGISPLAGLNPPTEE